MVWGEHVQREFSSVQWLSRVRLFALPWTAARPASLSITNTRSPPKLMSMVSVMPSNHLFLCHPLLLPSVFPSIRVFSNESALRIGQSIRVELWTNSPYGCESWTLKKAEHRRVDAFELWCWRRLLRVPWTAGKSNQSIVKEISPGCSFEGLMLKLKLKYFGHLMWRAESFEKIDAGKDWGQEEKGMTEDEMVGWHQWLNGHGFGWTPGVGDGQGGLVCCDSWGHKESDTIEQLNWTVVKNLKLQE